MIQGFNHNVRYGGRVFHVQTEDSGLTNPHIITHLYHGGTIVASTKTSYADILTSDRRDQAIRELMKEQHRRMLLDLRDGRLDRSLAEHRLAPERPSTEAKAATAQGDAPGSKAESLDDILLDYLASRSAPGEPRKP
jgi:hypothetical protein